MARSLLAEQPELRRLPRGQRSAVRRSLVMLAGELKDRDAVVEWLNRGRADLGMERPIDVIRAGRADVVEQLLSDALKGIPS